MHLKLCDKKKINDGPFICRLAAARNGITTIKRINEKNQGLKKNPGDYHVKTFSGRTKKRWKKKFDINVEKHLNICPGPWTSVELTMLLLLKFSSLHLFIISAIFRLLEQFKAWIAYLRHSISWWMFWRFFFLASMNLFPYSCSRQITFGSRWLHSEFNFSTKDWIDIRQKKLSSNNSKGNTKQCRMIKKKYAIFFCVYFVAFCAFELTWS